MGDSKQDRHEGFIIHCFVGNFGNNAKLRPQITLAEFETCTNDNVMPDYQ